jgi:hypothetical protein
MRSDPCQPILGDLPVAGSKLWNETHSFLPRQDKGMAGSIKDAVFMTV